MLFRLILLWAIALQAAVVSTGASHAYFQHATFTAPVCKGDAIPATPYSPIEHNGSCANCIACCDSHAPALSVIEPDARLIRSTSQTVIFSPVTILAPPKHSETPPARAPPA